MDNCCKPGLDIHPALGIVFEGFPLKLQRSWGWRSNTTSISFQKISHWMLGCLLKHFYNVICLTFKHRSRTIDIHILYLNGFKDRYGWTITCVIAWAKVARTMKHLLWLWNMAKWSRKWKNRESAIHILFLPQNWPTQWLTLSEAEGDCQDGFTKTVAPKCPESVPPSRDLYVSSRDVSIAASRWVCLMWRVGHKSLRYTFASWAKKNRWKTSLYLEDHPS